MSLAPDSPAARFAERAEYAGVPDLGYKPVPDIFKLPPNVSFGACSSVAVNSKGHILVFNRGKHVLMEFDGDGKFLRSLADGIFTNPHGLRVDDEDNIWTTDNVSHIVVKMDRDGRVRMVLGMKDSSSDWHHFGHLKGFDEPNDIAFGRAGEIYVTQGHGKGESRVLKFDADGDFLKSWGGEGAGPGQFNVPHSIVIDDAGLIYIADRSNQRIQVFDAEGTYLRETRHPGTPCGLCMSSDQHIFMAHGHTGLIMKLDRQGKVLGASGGMGRAPHRYGEAHFIARDQRDDIYVADTLNWRVQKLVKR